MRITKHRYFQNGNIYKAETIEFIKAGTEGIPLDDVRATEISGETGRWFPVAMNNPCFNTTLITPPVTAYKQVQLISDLDGTVSIVSVPLSYGSPVEMDVYNQPLTPGFSEITMEDYNNGMLPPP